MTTNLRVTLIRSTIRAVPKHKLTVQALGLRRMHHTVVKPNNAATRGMLRQVAHMVRVEAVEGDGEA